ncbi:MAG: hypothetical protein ABSG73_11020 [Candidatus Aminicenantales bacterium]|jgi:hypothetical protein
MSEAVSWMPSIYASYLTAPSGEGFDEASSAELYKRVQEGISQFLGSETYTFGIALDLVLKELDAIYEECSTEDWDGHGASPITPEAYSEAVSLIISLPRSVTIPEIVPEPTGGIGFEWFAGRNQILVMTVQGKNKLNYAGIFGGNKVCGSEYFDGPMPGKAFQQITRFFSR